MTVQHDPSTTKLGEPKNLLYQNELDRGKSTINEVRKECGLPPVEGGDVLLKKRD